MSKIYRLETGWLNDGKWTPGGFAKEIASPDDDDMIAAVEPFLRQDRYRPDQGDHARVTRGGVEIARMALDEAFWGS